MWALHDAGGNITHFQGILIDITERKKVELALQESEERLRTLINAMPDIVAFKDGEGRWLEANDFDLRLFQLEHVDYTGKKDSELAAFSTFYREAFLACEESDEISWKARTATRSDEVIPRPDGPPMTFDIIKVPTFYPDGRRKGLVVVGRDVTGRKRVEAELKLYQEQLEDLVRARTDELAEANDNLMAEIAERRRAEEKVLASLREKEILLKEVHHRVKNNLQIISSLLDLQSYSLSDAQARSFFRDSQERIKTMALVHEQLYKSKDLSYIEFGDYLRNLAASLACSFIGSSERIAVTVETDAFALDIDEAIPCGLIVNELISNALKHAFPDDCDGEISVICRSDSDGLVTLDVSDNGAGIPPDIDIRTTETLGLQIVNMLTNQLRGTIDLERTNGTLFRIRFMKGAEKRCLPGMS
jgi:PAS domain S-box-containing protein